MASSIPSHEDECPLAHLTEAHNLQLAYEESLRREEFIVAEEQTRRAMVVNLLLSHDSEELHAQLLSEDERRTQLQVQRDEIQGSLDLAEAELHRQEAHLRTRTREISNLKAELASMNDVTKDSAKLLTEKLTLARQLSTLRPELDHLRAQTANQQIVVAEKLALQRQLATLEVELDSEKKTAKRALLKANSTDKVDELVSQLEQLNNDMERSKLTHEKQISKLESELKTNKALLQKSRATTNDTEVELQSQLDAANKDIADQKRRFEKRFAAMENELEQEKISSEKIARGMSTKSTEKEEELMTEMNNLRKESAKAKKDMQKQITSLERSIEFEKKGAKEALQKETANSEREDELILELQTLRKESAKEAGNLRKKITELETALEDEKKDLKKAVDKTTSKSTRESSLIAQVEKLEEEIKQAKHEREQQQKTTEREVAELTNKQEILQGKLEDFRVKLRSTKTQLKETQQELAILQTAALKAGSTSARDQPTNPRKRAALSMSLDANIGTPDGVAVRGKRAGMKKGKADQPILNEKSTFSITPFLNRTINISMDTPEALNEAAEAEDELASPMPLAKVASIAAAEVIDGDATTTASKKITKPVLKELKAASTNSRSVTKKATTKETLQVVEEEDEDNEVPAESSNVPKLQKPLSVLKKVIGAEDGEVKKKKRKMLGGGAAKTLFDDEDAEISRRPSKVTLGGMKKMGPKGSLLGASVATGFAAFSPLKKDRRGVNASFLV